MRKTLLCLTFGLTAFLAVPKASAEHKVEVELDRAAWTVRGCSEHNANSGDGGFRHITDGNTSTFWHSEYGNSNHDTTCPHYFVIDRGENASEVPFSTFGFLPRQAAGNGFVQNYRLYVLDDVSGLNVAAAAANGSASIVSDNHASLTTFLENKTPTLQGNLDRVYNDATKRTLVKVDFPSEQTGRYVLFVIDSTSSSAGNDLHANCAEFYLYSSIDVDYPYYIRLTEAENTYLQLESSSNGTKAEVSTEVKTPVFLVPGTGDNDGKFAIMNAQTGKYFSSDTGWTSTYNNSSIYYWRFRELDDGNFVIAQSGNASNLAGTQADNIVWTDNYVGRTQNGWTAKVKWALEVCNDWIISADINNPGYVLIKNVRTTGRDGVTYAVTPGSSGQLELKLDDELNIGDRYDVGALWYMQQAGAVDAEGYVPVRIYNAYTTEAITNPATGSWATSGDDIIWYLKKNSQGDYSGFNILHAKDLTDTNVAWNDFQGSGTRVGYWNGNDAGSIWSVELAEVDKAEATLNEINAAYAAERKAYVDLINSYIENGMFAFSEEQQAAWTTAASAGIKNSDHLNQLMATLHQLVDDAFSGQVADGHNSHVQFLHDQRPVYIGKTSDGVRRGGDEGTRTFTLKNAEDGSGFYIFHEYSNQYVKHPTADNTNISLVSDQSEASIYNFDLSNASKGLVGVKVVGPEGHVNSNCYWHSNSTGDVTNVVRWVKGDNSAWYICFVDEAQAATEYLAGAINISGSLPESSDEVGFLKISSADEAKAAHEAAVALADDAVASEKRAAADAIYSAMASMEVVLNYPRSGEIYTITCPEASRGALTANLDAGNQYVWSSGKSGSNADANKWAVVEKDGRSYLYNVAVGKFVNAYGFLSNSSNKSLEGVAYAWMFGDVATEVTFNGEIFTQPTDGTTRKFVIAGGEDTTGKNRPGMMVIDWLDSPIPAIAGFSDEQDGCGFRFVKVEDASEELMATINAALNNMEAVAAATLEAAEAAVADLPENHSDIVNHYSGEGVALFNERMALIDENAAADKAYGISLQSLNALTGTMSLDMTDGFCYSIALAADGKKYHAFYGKASTDEFTPDEGDEIENIYNWRCTIEGNIASFRHELNSENIKFMLGEAELFTVSAGSKAGQVKLTPFAEATEATARRVAALSEEEEAGEAEPEYVLTSMGEDAGHKSTTAITEITAADDAVKVVYDLQGRRLATPVKGINIINGKKVVVK